MIINVLPYFFKTESQCIVCPLVVDRGHITKQINMFPGVHAQTQNHHK